MSKFLGRWLNIYKNEISLFLWTAALLFLIRCCGVYLNNYAETTFLKRFGVEYLPIVNMLNAVATLFIMGAMTGIITRIPGSRLLTRLFVFCGVSVAGLRFIIPLGYDLVYPLLFMLKSQYEVLLALLFWNLANDLFNTRQSKRLFPLITAGGIIGQILGSFTTPRMVTAFSIDNLLFVYLVITLIGAVVVKRMGNRFPALLLSNQTLTETSSKVPSRNNMIGEIKKIIPLMKSSPLINLMILLTFIPNVVIPIMNYQFNFAVNDQFASETNLINFFAYFRGVLNIVSLFLLLFVGRIYGRWGIPVALMFHPINYMFVFAAFLLRFDAYTAVYARMSANIIRSTINIPAMAVLNGLFPKSYRGLVRPFLRGTVVRIALFFGSGIILLSTNLFHPRYLSLVALPFVVAWMITTFVLKKRYSRILMDLISQDMFDMKSFEAEEIQQLFNDKAIRGLLAQSFLTSHGEDCLWYARLMRSFDLPDIDTRILKKMEAEADTNTVIGLLELLSPAVDKTAPAVFNRMALSAPPELKIALVKTAGRISPDLFSKFIGQQLTISTRPEVKGYAVAAFFDRDPEKYRPVIDDWLESDRNTERLAGVIAAGRTGRSDNIDQLKALLIKENNDNIIVEILNGLSHSDTPGLNRIIVPFLEDKNSAVRLAALATYEINDDQSLRTVVDLFQDISDQVIKEAKDKIINAEYHHDQLLVEWLALPKRKIREGLFDLIEKMDIKTIDTVQFTREQVEKSYLHLNEAIAVNSLPANPVQSLLNRHFMEKHRLHITNTLRVLSIMDSSGRIKKIYRGLNSADPHQKGNSVEALENLLERPLANILIPLLEVSDPSRQLDTGKKHFDLPEYPADPAVLVNHLAGQNDWVTKTLTHCMVRHMTPDQIDKEALTSMLPLNNKQVIDDESVSARTNAMDGEIEMADMMALPDKIIQLRKVEILKDLNVSELAAIAAIAEEEVFSTGDIVIREGEMSQVLYLVIEGKTSVIKNEGTDREIELARIKTNDYFGEMALLEEGRTRSATIRTEEPSRFLSLQKQELDEIINEYPKIALNFCRVLTRRLRSLDEKASALECAPEMQA